jgi:glutathione S-transferase
MLQLFHAPICPFAQRARALLEHLELPYESRVVDLENRDSEFLGLSPSGLVPLLVDSGVPGLQSDEGVVQPLLLYESRILVDYLIERGGWQGAWASDIGMRYLQRLAVQRFDDLIVPLHYRSMANPSALGELELAEIRVELERLATIIEQTHGQVVGAMAFCLAPFWARISWMRAHAPMLSILMENDIVRFWLDRALELPAIARTLPPRDETVASYRRRYVDGRPESEQAR